mmetsp:Transcript_19463/g.33421  ORF Transcript_19463/g.33421 Transcript_19463/m.33421 type:complete len:360 (+) Transcript_19463:759-1838(+)
MVTWVAVAAAPVALFGTTMPSSSPPTETPAIPSVTAWQSTRIPLSLARIWTMITVSIADRPMSLFAVPTMVKKIPARIPATLLPGCTRSKEIPATKIPTAKMAAAKAAAANVGAIRPSSSLPTDVPSIGSDAASPFTAMPLSWERITTMIAAEIPERPTSLFVALFLITATATVAAEVMMTTTTTTMCGRTVPNSPPAPPTIGSDEAWPSTTGTSSSAPVKTMETTTSSTRAVRPTFIFGRMSSFAVVVWLTTTQRIWQRRAIIATMLGRVTRDRGYRQPRANTTWWEKEARKFVPVPESLAMMKWSLALPLPMVVAVAVVLAVVVGSTSMISTRTMIFSTRVNIHRPHISLRTMIRRQ